MKTDHNTRNMALLQAGDRDGLITSNVPLVYRLVNKYRKQYVGRARAPRPRNWRQLAATPW